MEYYTEINELLDNIKKIKTPQDESLEKLKKYFVEESGKEIYLMFSEWLSLLDSFPFALFKRLSGLIIILIDKLKTSSPLISQEFIELIFQLTSSFTPEQLMEIPEFIQEETPTDPSATYYIYLSLFVPEFPQKNAEIVLNLFLNGSTEVTKEVAVTFSKYPHSYQLSFSRCALYFPDKFTLLSLERLSLLLMKSGRPHLQNDGIKLSSFITNPTSPRDLFTSIVTSGPYLSTIEAARSSWSTALKILNSMNEENKFHTLRLVLESPETPEATLCVIIQELKRIIHSSKSGLFRSPMVGNTLLPLIMNPNVTRNPVGKTELLVTSLNFLQYLLIVDKRIHCFALFGNQNQMKNIQKAVDEVKVALKKSKSDNEKPKEKILENMKKVNFGKELTRNDIDKVVESTNLSIARVQFNVELIEEVLNAN